MMLQHRLNRLFGTCLTIGLLSCSLFAAYAAAQMKATDPATLRVTLIKAKPGHGAAVRAIQRDVILNYQKNAKWAWSSFYRVRFGDATYASVTDIANYDKPGNMPEADSRRFQEASRESVEWSRTHVQHKLTDLSFGGALDKPAAHISVSTITVAPGRRGDFIKNFKANGLPRWKKMGIPWLTTWEILYGEDSGKFVVVVPIANYAELSQGTPFYRGMSEADRAQVLTGMEGVILDIQRSVGDYMEDLSFVPGQ